MHTAAFNHTAATPDSLIHHKPVTQKHSPCNHDNSSSPCSLSTGLAALHKRKRTPKQVSHDRFLKIAEGYKNTYKKKLSEISKKYYNERIKTAFYHLLCILEVSPDEQIEKTSTFLMKYLTCSRQ